MSGLARSRISAVLGPTNTGKTYLAIERLLGHASGMIGFPLRLLARENYDRAVRIKGARQVALVTGEEKIVPAGARYFFCTVESMPIDRAVAFLAVDEIQLAADPERGHVFTDRLLHARGAEETMFLGAETVRPLLRRLVPEAEIVTRPRFSTLGYSGQRKLVRLPPRSAVVAFSVAEVYELAEALRRRRGGTAVVLGALSPRTRNAQVALFEEGEVDYLVATDAIGMGLNLKVDHVAFARLSKFDGRGYRDLSAAEVAQIAGRAGRHMSDGTFGTTEDAGAFAPETIERVENHHFEPLRQLYWRNRSLDFRAPKLLLRSLEEPPPSADLIRLDGADDARALAVLARDPEIAALAGDRASVRLLWEVCQIPDFRKLYSDQHLRLLRRIYRRLLGNDGRLAPDWLARQMAAADRQDGDIDTLTARIAEIRVWTYIAHRGDWLADSAQWQERARAIEDRLSDALHERLTQRFVDRRAAHLVRRLSGGTQLLGAVKSDGNVLVEGQFVGRLEGFRFHPDRSVGSAEARPLLTAARRALGADMARRLERLERDGDGTLALTPEGELLWRAVAIGRLARGATPLAPAVETYDSDFLDSGGRERVRRRLAAWVEGHLARSLVPLLALRDAALSGAARGLAFQLVEALGTLPRARVAALIEELTRSERRRLAALGVKLGRQAVYLPALLGTRSSQLRSLLLAIHRGHGRETTALAAGALSLEAGASDEAACLAAGYLRVAEPGRALALRADAIERLVAAAWRLSKQGSFAPSQQLLAIAGCDEEGLALALAALGYRVERSESGLALRRRAPRKRCNQTAQRPRQQDRAASSPFAKLRELSWGK
ncbi:MAG: helicase-related protein [Kiloniellales bacterium]